MAPATYVPAWKRLGLKVKPSHEAPQSYPPAGNDLPEREEIDQSISNGEDRTQSTAKLAHAPKRQRKQALDTASSSQSQTPHNGNVNPLLDSKLLPSRRRQKSVSFASGAKTEDGESTKDLYKTWLAQQDLESHSSDVTKALREVPQSKSVNGSEATGKKNAKKRKRSSKEGPKVIKPSCHKASKALKYLEEYRTSSPAWKFNKTMQTFLLHQAFDLSKIPPSYDHVLRTYLAGLAGMSSRGRLRGQASILCKEDDNALVQEDTGSETMTEVETSEASSQKADELTRQSLKDRKDEYRAALREYKEQLGRGTVPEPHVQEVTKDDYFTMRLCRRQRAELLLWGVKWDSKELQANGSTLNENKAPETSHPEEMEEVAESKAEKVEVVTESNGAKGKRKRKRKKRLAVAEDTSSSSSESSDTDD